MISFRSVTKRYADGTTAADDLTLEIAAGEVCVLVGPSGCGKTTSLRMINRMVEPTDGSIVVEGEDIAGVDPAQLRRRMGYVIQHTGLFPHRSVAQNIATVPKLGKWDKKRIAERVTELVRLVGLPEEATHRYPRQLSGGQQQRVGVARALAADPPIMLMDEPFAATDPITRERLQDEFLRLQRKVRKTTVFVTHDIDEAIKMGDRIAILREGGTLAQFASPEELLANPADDFVADFLGQDRGLKRLALIPVSKLPVRTGPVAHVGDSPRDLAAIASTHGTEWVVVLDDSAAPKGWQPVPIADGGDEIHRPLRTPVGPDTSLRSVLDIMVTSGYDTVVRVDTEGRFEGVLTHDQVHSHLAGREPA